jgi:hypothetical protein
MVHFFQLQLFKFQYALLIIQYTDKFLSFFQVKEILEQVLVKLASKTAKVLLVAANDHEAQKLSSSLKHEICTVPGDSHSSTFTICSR